MGKKKDARKLGDSDFVPSFMVKKLRVKGVLTKKEYDSIMKRRWKRVGKNISL